MIDLTIILSEIAWPIALLIAWFFGELAHRWARLPRICAYATIGFFLAYSQIGFLPSSQSASILLLANIAFGLLLFECGYRINLRWLRVNPWIAATSLTEVTFTFTAVYSLSIWFEQAHTTALLLAALSMATSPATVVRVITELHSSGQATERVIHLSALNSMFAVLVFKVIVGLVVFKTSGNIWEATYSSLIVLMTSGFLGAIFGLLVPTILGFAKRASNDSTLVFTIAIIVLVTLTHSLKLSPVFAVLTFGLAARHGRIVLNPSQSGFGALGDLLSVFLFMFAAATLELHQVIGGIGLGLVIILVRQIAKISGILLFAHFSGVSWRKGFLIGIATAPMSVFVILILEQSRYVGINLIDQLAPLAAASLILEVLGPILIQRALIWAHEVPETKIV